VRRFLAIIDQINEWTGKWITLLLYAFTILICTEVTLRYGFDHPTIYLPVIFTMTAAAMYSLSFGYVMLHDAHVRIDLFYRLLSRRGKAIMDAIFAALFFFPVIGSLVYTGAWWVWFAWSTDERSHQTFWYARTGPVRTVVFIGLLLFLLQGLSQLVRNLDVIFKRKEGPKCS
jgi:TRAP-type mannitol/chloroaromatic compound transport system permease small subunit